MRLSPNGSRGTCIPQGLSTFLHAAFTAHPWRATTTAGSLCCARNSTFRPAPCAANFHFHVLGLEHLQHRVVHVL